MAAKKGPGSGKAETAPGKAQSRGAFASRLGFILAAIGSAVGFGSIARFPMNAANNGGAMFLVTYAAIMVFIGIPVMIAEFSMGRSAQRNTVGAFPVLTGEPKTRWKGAGFLFFLLAAFVLSYYSILSGWTLRYFFASMNGAYFDNQGEFLADTTEGPIALAWHAVVMVLTALVLTTTISKGIEKVNLFMMPALYLIIIGIAVYAATLDNVAEGYEFYLEPSADAFTLPVVSAAVGQAFFSLSLAQGAMMIYASYLPKTSSLASNSAIISFSTLAFATMCGFMIFPLLSTFGLLSGETAGLSLIFGPLAQAFGEMGQPVGNIVGSFFFLATFFASFTSAISLAEPGVAYVIEQHKIDRRRSAILVCALIYIAGIAVAFSADLLDLEGGKMTDVGIILGGILITLFVGWYTPKKQALQRMDEAESGLRLGRYIYPVIRYVIPAILVVLLVFALIGTPCGLSGGSEDVGLIERLNGPGLAGCDG